LLSLTRWAGPVGLSVRLRVRILQGTVATDTRQDGTGFIPASPGFIFVKGTMKRSELHWSTFTGCYNGPIILKFKTNFLPWY